VAILTDGTRALSLRALIVCGSVIKAVSRRPRDVFLRVLLTIGLAAPATALFVGFDGRLVEQRAGAARELLGVQYLRALQPLATALGQAQSAAVNGDSAATRSAAAALDTAIADAAAVDERIGDELGTRARWRDLRTRIAALPDDGEARGVYTVYRDVSGLLRALTTRVGELSGLTNDAETDAYYLHRAVTTDLPDLVLAAGRLSDVAVISTGTATKPADLAELIALHRQITAVGELLDEDVQAAASATPEGLPTTTVHGALEVVRTELGRFLAAADTVIDTDVKPAEAAAVAAARTKLGTATATLSVTIFDELRTLLGNRRDSASTGQTLGLVALMVAVALAMVPTVAGAVDYLRHRRARPAFELGTSTPARPEGTAATERERVGASQ
jgi:hypothetical protein